MFSIFGDKIFFVPWKADLINQYRKRTQKRRRDKVPQSLIRRKMYLTPSWNLHFFLGSRADSMSIVVETGASCSLSPHCLDFESLRPINLKIGTINVASKVEGVGIVSWEVTDQNGAKSVIRTEAYYIPSPF